ncbi:uncharacterized protein LOC133185163 [Saccostrea echinata]|uniref:uncharacterized protein LOC133185163 n=1 Tax=Saccostrea echinata TaxID=191078 RepID=UPI002A805B7B|nr:uncharacterized protein LOC133185163 [Saccostrea echinata]
MEPAMAVNILTTIKDKGHEVKTLVMDDDTMTISKFRSEVDKTIQKCSDKNHTIKNFTSSLYALQKDKTLQRKCDVSWCRYLQHPETYVPRNLPYGKYLSNQDLFDRLLQIFTTYAEKSDKLLTLGSTQSNESFNGLVSVKNSKNRFYSGSESTSHRVAAAVCQKNLGEEYLLQTHEELSLSPGRQTERHVSIQKKRKEREDSLRRTVAHKRRRNELKHSSQNKTTTTEMREGLSYKTAVDLAGYSSESTEEIPSPMQPVEQTPLPTACYTHVYFDLETTGLGLAEITQIEAVHNREEFSIYVEPKVPISLAATKVTGITYDGTTMFKNGKPVPCYPLEHALSKFQVFLQKFNNPVLFAHNCQQFDSVVLCHAMQSVPNLKLEESFCGFCDTLHLMKGILPLQKSYSQEALVDVILNEKYSAHDALEDWQKTLRQENFISLQPLVRGKCISENMAKKIANSGLCLHHLKLAFHRDSHDGIRILFSEKTNGKARVTNRTKIISSVSQFLQDQFSVPKS